MLQGITTWQKDANVVYRKSAGMGMHDFLLRELRATCKPFVGRTASATGILAVKSAVETKLNALINSAQNTDGILTPGINGDGTLDPAWKNLTIRFDGFDAIYITVEVHFVGEMAYFLIEADATPAMITV